MNIGTVCPLCLDQNTVWFHNLGYNPRDSRTTLKNQITVRQIANWKTNLYPIVNVNQCICFAVTLIPFQALVRRLHQIQPHPNSEFQEDFKEISKTLEGSLVYTCA